MKTILLNIPAFRKNLLAWYRKNKRDLPWRRTNDPYRILVSEMMLQQTQVDTVIPYYRRFIKTFPNPTALARASEQDVLKLWEGLGYYSRAKNLYQAAGEIQSRFGGKVPGSLEELESLPGIGRYSAGAVASIAFGIPAPIVDGNVKRVLCRIFGITEDPSKTAVKNRLWELAGGLVPKRGPGDFNQALMEFGATVCTPRKPSCGTCPVQEKCRAHKLGIEDKLPRKAAPKAVPKLRMRVAVIQSGRHLLLARRPDDGLLGGLWAPPEFDWKKVPKEKTLRKKIERNLGIKTDPGMALEPVVQVYSHRRITYYPRLLTAARKFPAGPWKWIPMDKIQGYPIPNAMKKILVQVLRREDIPIAAEKSAIYSP